MQASQDCALAESSFEHTSAVPSQQKDVLALNQQRAFPDWMSTVSHPSPVHLHVLLPLPCSPSPEEGYGILSDIQSKEP